MLSENEGTAVNSQATDDGKVILLDEMPVSRLKYRQTRNLPEHLTDESCSEDHELSMAEQARGKASPARAFGTKAVRFIPFVTVQVEPEDSRTIESREKSTEMAKSKLALRSSTPKTPSGSQEETNGRHTTLDVRDMFSQKAGSGEKKVPLAPRNQNKINFNFERGFLADRSEKKVKTAASVCAPLTLLEDQLTLRIGNVKSKNRPSKIDYDNELNLRGKFDLTIKTSPDESPLMQSTDFALVMEEKIRQKDRVIEELRSEIDVLNGRNKLLSSEVAELRLTIARFESQFSLLSKPSLDLRASDSKLAVLQKVGRPHEGQNHR